MLLLLPLAWAGPPDSPLDDMVDKLRRDSMEHVLWGAPGEVPQERREAAERLREDLEPWLQARLRVNYAEGRTAAVGANADGFQWYVREWGRIAVGDLQPVNLLGDEEGLGAFRGGLEFEAYTDHLEFRFSPELRLDAVCEEDPVCGSAPLSEALLAVNWKGLRLDVGMENREAGPGVRGNLILGRSIRPWPAGTLHYTRDSKWGLWAAETGVGWLPGQREDVLNPGLMHMDFRYSPIAALEFGFTRGTMFGGQGRPLPTLFDLLIPIQPHVSGDPDKLLADSNEIVGVDARVDIPLKRWLDGPVNRVSLWIQYAGEDLIVSELGPLPMPSLGGPANLYGGSVSFGDSELRIERAQLMDDTFRWYTRHRVYHEGFVRDGHPIGYPHGGDADSLWVEWSNYGALWGYSVHVEKLRRVGVVTAIPEGVFTLATEEHSLRAGFRTWVLPSRGGHIGLGYSVQRMTGQDFVADTLSWRHRGWVELTRAFR